MFLEVVYSATGPHYWPSSKFDTIFRNFDPEKYGDEKWRADFESKFGHDVLRLLRELIDVCAYWYLSKDNVLKKKYLTNKEFIRLGNITHDLYYSGCVIEQGKPKQIAEITTMYDWEIYIEVVKTGYKAHAQLAQRPGQIIGICILLMLDLVLSQILMTGFTKANLNDLLVVCRLQVESERTDDATAGHHEERRKASEKAKKGGDGKAAKYEALEAETIRLYLEGNWSSVPVASLEITPKIVALSKTLGVNLFASSTKPLEWIRAYKKAKKKEASA